MNKDLTFILTTPGELRIGIQPDEIVVTIRGGAKLEKDLIDFYRKGLQEFFKGLLDNSRVEILTEEELRLVHEAEEKLWGAQEGNQDF